MKTRLLAGTPVRAEGTLRELSQDELSAVAGGSKQKNPGKKQMNPG